MAEQIKRLENGVRSFQANGRKYIVHETLTTDAYQTLEELQVEIQAGNDTAALLKLLQKAIAGMQKNDVYNASIALYNATNISERINERRPAVWLLMLTLFARPEGADLSTWTEAEALEWIADWNAEGYASTDLFQLAFTCKQAFDTDFGLNSPGFFGEESAPSGESGQVKANS